MNLEQVLSSLEKVIPAALFGALALDWLRLRMARRSEEKKHISRVISDLLELRYNVLLFQSLPKMLTALFPKQILDQIPDEILRPELIKVLSPLLLSGNDELIGRYQKAVDEIAGFRPLLAFRLRGKERYFNAQQMLTEHFNKMEAATTILRVTQLLEQEFIPPVEDTLRVLARSYSIGMRFSIGRALRTKPSEKDHEDVIKQLREILIKGMTEAGLLNESGNLLISSQPGNP